MVDTRPHLVWMSAVSWDAIRGTDRHLATAMTRYARLVWVDPPVSPLTRTQRRGETPRTVRPLLSVVDDQIIRLTPTVLPGLSRPGVRATTAPLVRAQVRWALGRIGIRPVAVVATHLEDVLGRWGDGVVNMLYGTDDYVAGAALMRLPVDRLKMQERHALARADVVAVVSPQLADRWTALGAKPTLVPNGCNPVGEHVDDLPSAATGLPRPVIGLIGQLSERIDLDLLNKIVDAGFSLLMVGPRDARWEPGRFEALITRPRVHYAGQVPAEEVPSYLAAIDVGTTPYVDSPFNRSSFPLKTLEYLGAGRPVVSTDLRSARWLLDDLTRSDQACIADQILALARGSDEFVAAVRRMTRAPHARADVRHNHGSVSDGARLARAAQCRAFARRHSWSRRADAFAALLGLTVAGPQHADPSLAGRHP
jgi:teichuronic acid biosynthesis glycosyltransferase TuaH